MSDDPGPDTATLAETTLRVSGAHFSYGGVAALNGVDLQAEPGAITCIMGRNGVGKTTLVKTICGILPLKTGSVHLGPRNLSSLPAHRRARAGIGLVPQGREIFPKLTVAENLMVGCQARSDGRRQPPDAIWDLFEILRPMRARMGGDLSGGQQQQLAIARALAGDPKVLLLDEPTEGIQPNIIQEIGRVLRRLAEGGMTIILVEQYLDFVREIGDTFVIMDRGRHVASDHMSELSDALVARYLSV
ncbi:MAG: urea ABC transporter ATP-binding subunit UrtE [Planctomycetota bacterium]|nr:MAG: urea ABC transporter ATP-binding subunit UrtE [Planctomycetota bacterium]